LLLCSCIRTLLRRCRFLHGLAGIGATGQLIDHFIAAGAADTSIRHGLFDIFARRQGRGELVGRRNRNGLLLCGGIRGLLGRLSLLHRVARIGAGCQLVDHFIAAGTADTSICHGLFDIIARRQGGRELIGSGDRNGLLIGNRVLLLLRRIRLLHCVARTRAIGQGVFKRAGKGIAATRFFERLLDVVTGGEGLRQSVGRA